MGEEVVDLAAQLARLLRQFARHAQAVGGRFLLSCPAQEA